MFQKCRRMFSENSRRCLHYFFASTISISTRRMAMLRSNNLNPAQALEIWELKLKTAQCWRSKPVTGRLLSALQGLVSRKIVNSKCKYQGIFNKCLEWDYWEPIWSWSTLLLDDNTLKIEALNPHDFLHFWDVMTFCFLSETTAAEYQLFYQ